MDNQLEDRIRSRITLDQKTDAPVSGLLEDRIAQRLRDKQDQERAAVQRSLTLSIDKDPNQLAQVNKIAKETGLDREAIEANAAMFLQRQKERGILAASERSPALSKSYADPNFAGLAKDDADQLSSISDYVGAFTSYVMGARRGGGLPQDLAALYYGTKQSSESLGRMALEPIGQAGRALGFEDNIFEKVARDYANMAKATEEGYKKIAPLPDTFWERSARSGIQSGAQMVKYIPMAFAGPAGWKAALTMMSAESASNTYQQDREKGVDIGRSLNHAAMDGIAEYTMERYFGFAGFAKRLVAGQSATKLLAYEIFREIPGEMGTTLWQNFNEWAIINPQKSLSDFLSEQPEALAETAVATIFGGAIQTGAGRSSLKLIEAIQGRQLEATEALQRAEALQQALQTAMNTKLAELSPEEFTRVVNEMGENAPVRFDARLLADVFAQSGLQAEELQRRLPSAFEQLQEGTIDNREISIPVGEFISGVMNTPLQEQLQDYARLGDSEYSKAEAQEAMKTASEFLNTEATRVLQQAQDQQAWQESVDDVKSTILKQLNDAGTFKPDVNEWFATLQGAFFSTMAERTGVTPKEFYQQFSLTVQSAAQVEITGNTAEERLLDAIKKASQQFRSVEDATAAMIDFGHAVYRVIPGQAPVLITDAAQLPTIPLKELRMIDRSMLDDQGNVYAQSATIRRGTFNPQKMLIELTQSADLSTFIHESGHFFLEVMVDLASRPNAPQSVIDDVGLVMSWFGMDINTWKGLTVEQKRKHHELFAESFERYMFDGKAPTAELQPMFRTFSAWIKRVYSAIKNIMSSRKQRLPDEIRQVFDRMLATEEQIADAERLAGLMPNQEATDAAIEELQARSLKDLKWAANAQSKLIKKMQREAEEFRKGVESEVRERVALMPIYRAMRWIRTGEMVDLDSGDTIKATQGYKLSSEAIEQMFPETMLARPDLTRLRGMTSKEGLHPDIVADMFGFANGDIMVRELTVATPQKEMIDGMTSEEMLNRYGDITSPEALKIAAMEAVHNEVRAKALATELKAQEDALAGTTDTGRRDVRGRPITVNSLVQAAKLFADNVTSRTPARLLKREIQNHRRAELRASKEWSAATKKGDTKAALQAKRDQLLNHQTVKAMQDAQAEIQKAMAFFKTVNRGNNETLVKRGRDPDVVNAARAILAEYGISPAQGKKANEYMEIVKNNDPTMYAALEPAMLAAMADSKPIDQLTVQEIKALADEVGAFWHLSKRSRKMEVDGDLIDIEEAEAMLTARMDEIGVPASMPGEAQALTKKDERKRSIQFAGALLRRAEQWAEGMDGKYGGPFTKLIFDPIKKAANEYRKARVDARKKFTELVKALEPVMEAKLISAPELNYTFGQSANSNGVGMAELLHAIIHTGNQSNKRKLLLGRGWATENDDGTLDTGRWDAFIDRMIREGTLKKEHYDFAQGVWDLLESMKAGAQKTHREVFGRYFDEVTADPFVTPFGPYKGGYAPAQVDARLVTDAALRTLAETENESMAFSFPTTNRGFTKGRVEYNRPLLLDLRALTQHLDKVLLFTHMEPAVRDVNRLLRRNGVSKPLSRIQPAAYDGMLIPWLNRAAKQQVETPVAGDGKLTRILSVARTRAGMSLMFANISNTFQQVTGLSSAAVIVKPSHLKRATAQYIKDPKGFAEGVAGASIFMDDRMKNEIAAINNAMEEILINPTTYQRAQTWSNRHAYFLQSAFDNVIGPIVWTGAYNQALEEGMTETQAIKFADGAVRKTQGSTLPEDISRIESGPAYARLFTQFVGYFNMVANTNATALKNLSNDVGLKKGAGKAFYILMMGVLLPAWVAEAIAVAFRGGPEDEDDDGYLDDWLSAVIGMGTLKFALASIPFFGQAATAGINRFNGNPNDDRIAASPAVSLIESAVAAPYSVYKAIADDGSAATAVRDVSTLLSVTTGLPVRAAAKPLVYSIGVSEGRIEPESAADVVRGLLTGTASPESKVQ